MSTFFSDVLERLNVALFERQSSSQFQCIGRLPRWCEGFFPSAEDQPIDLAMQSEFLEDFLIDAESFWEDPDGSRLASKVWTEVNSQQISRSLKAFAIAVSGRPLLAIVDWSDSDNDNEANAIGAVDNAESLVTKLPNRQDFSKQLMQLIEKGSADLQLALYYLELDNFNGINESLGYDDGELLLNRLAARITQSVKRTDLVAHLGGDEFVVVAQVKQHHDMEIIAQRILDSMIPPVIIDGTDFKITVSVGVAVFPANGSDVAKLLQHGNLAMSRAKELGGNQYQFFK